MALIKHTSALTLNVTGVIKDLVLILWSVFVNGAIIIFIQYVGYSIASAGVIGYSEYKRRLGLKPPKPMPVTPVPSADESNALAKGASQKKGMRPTRKYGALEEDETA